MRCLSQFVKSRFLPGVLQVVFLFSGFLSESRALCWCPLCPHFLGFLPSCSILHSMEDEFLTTLRLWLTWSLGRRCGCTGDCVVVLLRLVAWLRLNGSVRLATGVGAGQRSNDAFGAISRVLKVIGCVGFLLFLLKGEKEKVNKCNHVKRSSSVGPLCLGQKAKKSTAEAPPSLTPQVDVVGLLRGLGCSEAVLAEVQGRLAPEPKARTPGARASQVS